MGSILILGRAMVQNIGKMIAVLWSIYFPKILLLQSIESDGFLKSLTALGETVVIAYIILLIVRVLKPKKDETQEKIATALQNLSMSLSLMNQDHERMLQIGADAINKMSGLNTSLTELKGVIDANKDTLARIEGKLQ